MKLFFSLHTKKKYHKVLNIKLKFIVIRRRERDRAPFFPFRRPSSNFYLHLLGLFDKNRLFTHLKKFYLAFFFWHVPQLVTINIQRNPQKLYFFSHFQLISQIFSSHDQKNFLSFFPAKFFFSLLLKYFFFLFTKHKFFFTFFFCDSDCEIRVIPTTFHELLSQ